MQRTTKLVLDSVKRVRYLKPSVKATGKGAREYDNSTPVVEGTVPHIVTGKFGATKVLLRPASPGTGVIASSTVRSILDAAGYTNVLTKVIGSNNAHNVVKATLNALSLLESPEAYAVRVGKSVDEVMENYTVGSHVWNTLTIIGVYNDKIESDIEEKRDWFD